MKDLTEEFAYHNSNIFAEQGLDPLNFGCVMANYETPEPYIEAIPKSYLVDQDPTESNEISHVTLRYGLLRPATDQVKAIHAALRTWKPPLLFRTEKIGYFSNFDFDVVYLQPVEVESYREAYVRLGRIANVTLHPEYTPHLTLAYVHAGAGPEVVELLNRHGLVAIANLRSWGFTGLEYS